MTSLNTKKVLKALMKKGFKAADNKSLDHKRVEFWYKGRLTRCNTKFSHNNQEINDYLISHMSKQIQLSKNEFVKFANCTLTENEYIDILKEKGLI
jgi:predicted RNA binding protein YcfA (HicA-like mRNA interferase family)